MYSNEDYKFIEENENMEESIMNDIQLMKL